MDQPRLWDYALLIKRKYADAFLSGVKPIEARKGWSIFSNLGKGAVLGFNWCTSVQVICVVEWAVSFRDARTMVD